MRDTTKLIALGRATTPAKAQIQIYSPAGEGLLVFSVDASLYYVMIREFANLINLVGSRQHHSFRMDIG
jgi:hypothetical protein